MSRNNFKQYFKYFRKKRKVEHDLQAIRKINAVEELIRQKFMLVDIANYQVAMLDNLWSMYAAEKQVYLCENIIFYCNIQNAYKGDEVKSDKNLLISLKYEDNSVVPFAYFDGKEVIEYAHPEN